MADTLTMNRTAPHVFGSAPADQPHVAFDLSSGLLWGSGKTLADCKVAALWSRRSLALAPAAVGLMDAIRLHGFDVAWDLGADGVAVLRAESSNRGDEP